MKSILLTILFFSSAISLHFIALFYLLAWLKRNEPIAPDSIFESGLMGK